MIGNGLTLSSCGLVHMPSAVVWPACPKIIEAKEVLSIRTVPSTGIPASKFMKLNLFQVHMSQKDVRSYTW